jgi:hypothetical protein
MVVGQDSNLSQVLSERLQRIDGARALVLNSLDGLELFSGLRGFFCFLDCCLQNFTRIAKRLAFYWLLSFFKSVNLDSKGRTDEQPMINQYSPACAPATEQV